jgi:membrane protein DedA with SNARE-associated domain
MRAVRLPLASALVAVTVAGRLHHHFHGSPLGYLAVAAAVLASWAGAPGPGEPVLITAAILAARGKLDLAEVLGIAWVSAVAGGVGGWLLGRHFGRALVTARGPLHDWRVTAVGRGERFFARYGIFAVYLVPCWVAGIAHMPASRFIPANAIAALVWVLLVGLGGYLVGPSLTDVIDDIGLIGVVAIGAVAAVAVVAALVRRRRRR